MKFSVSAVAFATSLLLSAAAFAQAPALIPVQGFLTDDEGEARDGEVVMDLRIFDASVGGTELYSESQVVDVDMGYFTTELGLGDALDLSLFVNGGDVWVEIEIDADILEPRLQFGTAPFAAWAEWAGDAETVGGLTPEELTAPPAWGEITGVPEDIADGDDDTFDWADLTGIPEDIADGDQVGEEVDLSGYQVRVVGECPEGSSIRTIAADGTVTCQLDTDTDTNTTYEAGPGLSLTGSAFSVDSTQFQVRITASCGENESIRSITAEGDVVCETDDDEDTTYTAGEGLALDGTEFSVDAEAFQVRVGGECAEGSSIRVIYEDGTVECEADTDTDSDTTYSAGSGLALTGTTFTADTSVVQARVTGSCDPGQHIRAIAANGTVVCEADTDTDTTYSAGGGLALSGTTFSIPTDGVNAARIAANAVGASELANDAVDLAAMQNNSVGSAEIVNGSIVADDLAPNSVTASEIATGAVGAAEIATGAVGSSEIADGAVGPAEITIPIGSHSATMSLASGTNYIMPTASFTPSDSGTCIVNTTAFVSTTTSSTYGSTFIRTARQVGSGTPTTDPHTGPYSVPIPGRSYSTPVAVSHAWSVNAGTQYRFGCYIVTGGDFVGRTGFCRVTYQCF